MDPVSGYAADRRAEATLDRGWSLAALDRNAARHHAEALIALNAASEWDDWTVDHLLADRPGKWRLSGLACEGSDPVGFAVASRRDADVHLHHLVVASRMRGRGVGASLVERLEANARRIGADRLTLKVWQANTRAQRFYARLGFEVDPVEVTEGYVLMARDLSEDA